jgi:hypothetical protein
MAEANIACTRCTLGTILPADFLQLEQPRSSLQLGVSLAVVVRRSSADLTTTHESGRLERCEKRAAPRFSHCTKVGRQVSGRLTGLTPLSSVAFGSVLRATRLSTTALAL